MGKQRTQNKQSNNSAAAKKIVQVAVLDAAADTISGFIKTWAKKEIKDIIGKDKMPVLIPLRNNGIQVGRFSVIKTGTMWELQNYYKERQHLFYDKRSAVLYCILYNKNWFKNAADVLECDNNLGKLESQLLYYTNSIKQAAKKKNYEKLDIAASRYYDAVECVKYARNDLEKTLRLNKYLKIWETGYHYET